MAKQIKWIFGLLSHKLVHKTQLKKLSKTLPLKSQDRQYYTVVDARFSLPVSLFVFATLPATTLHFSVAPLANPLKPPVVLRLGVTGLRKEEERPGDRSLNQ